MLLLGVDLGTSSVKVSVVDAATQRLLASAKYPDTETGIISTQPGWAEQSPERWWEDVQQAIRLCHVSGGYDPAEIGAIGIAYQMHGLVLVDKQQQVLRNAIIWCDSRAVAIGEKAFEEMVEERCLSHLLNSPGNFTASKLAWVKQHEPAIYEQIDKLMLPGDFIAMKMTGDCTTTVSALSEGIFWDFREQGLSAGLLDYFGFDRAFFPVIKDLFTAHGYLQRAVATRLSLKPGIPVSYKAGDQPNNALSVNVLQPGEVAATAGTSGVIYGVSNELNYDRQSRINSFAHVNHTKEDTRIGVLLCINGTGIFNRWIKNIAGAGLSYEDLNEAAAQVTPGAQGLLALPFGNGAERMLSNQVIGSHFHCLDLNIHTVSHLVRAVQEGIAFSFRYGLDIMRENGIRPAVVRAARTNLFLSKVFTRSFTAINNLAVEFYEGDGSYGAAIGAGTGAGVYKNVWEAASSRKPSAIVEPENNLQLEEVYTKWKDRLAAQLNRG